MLTLAVSGGCVPRSVEPHASLETFTAYLDARIPNLMHRYGVPGLSLALVRGGEPVWSTAYGHADLDQQLAMTTGAVCRAESISKSVTSWGVLKLVEQGVLELDAPIQQYLRSWTLPESAFPEESVTVRRLLSGSAGLPLGAVGIVYPPEGEVPTLRHALTQEARLVRAPGAGFEYSNVGFYLLELLVEEVTGRPFAEYMADEVLTPLGMNRSSFAWNEDLRAALPTAYDLRGRAVPVYVYPAKASGGLFATVEDLGRFVAAGTAGSARGKAVLSEEGIRLLHTAQVEALGIFGVVADGYGLGHFVETMPDGRHAAWHGGQGTGWMTHFHVVPESGDGIVILTNSQRSWPLMAQVLSDWARWSGSGSVKWGRLTYAVSAMWALVSAVVLIGLAQSYRLAAGLRRGERRLAPRAHEARSARLLQALFGVGVITALAWAATQPYLFVTSVFPGVAEWAALAFFLLAVVSFASALLPRSGAEGGIRGRPQHRADRPGTAAAARAIAVLLAASASGCAPAGGSSLDVTPPRTIEQLEHAVAEVLRETGTPGVGIVLLDRAGIRWAGGVGIADRASGTLVDTGTMFRWGSISKSFVSVAVLQLQEQGRIRLDDRARELIPEIEYTNRWEATHPVRVVHLLEHTTGFDDIHLVEYGYRNADFTLRQGLDFHPHSRISRWPPGTHFSYSNSGPPMAAYALEKLTGQPFEEYAVEHVLRPLGITVGSFLYTPEVQRRLATSYQRDGRTPMPYIHLIIRPSGSVSATPAEMGAFVRMLLNRGSADGIRILEAASVDRMETPASALYARHGLTAGYGLGNFSAPRDGFLWRGHTGGIDGFLARYGYLPEHGVGYAYSINAENAEAFDRIGELIRAHLTQDLEPLPPTPALNAPVDLEQYTGFYVLAASRNEVTRFSDRLIDVVRVRNAGGRLVARTLVGSEVELLPLGGGRFRTAEDPVATLVFVEAGDARLLQGYNRAVWGSYQQASAPQRGLLWLLWLAAGTSIALMASALPFALLWIPRAIRGRRRRVPGIAVRAMPTLAAAFLAAAILLVVLAASDLLVRLGTPTVYSIGFAVLTVLFAVAALVGAVQVVRTRPVQVGRGVWVHAALVSGANLFVLLYLGAHGLIGMRFWTF